MPAVVSSPTRAAADRDWLRAVVRAIWVAELTDAADVDLNEVRVPCNWIEEGLLAGMLARFRLARLTHPTPARAGCLESRAIAFIAEQATDPQLRIDDVATALGVSVSSLSRAFRAGGVSFLALLHQTRIEFARHLPTSSLSVKAIAHAAGYTSTSRLDEHFRRASGTTPAAFRGSCNGRERWCASTHR